MAYLKSYKNKDRVEFERGKRGIDTPRKSKKSKKVMAKKGYSARTPAPMMSWIGKAFFAIVAFILTIIGINWLLGRGSAIAGNAKGDLFSGLNSLTVGAVAGGKLTAQRKDELNEIADAVYESMEGPGMWNNDFIHAMQRIETDAEYEYFNNTAFGKRDSYTLAEWMNDEWDLWQSDRDEINDNWASKGMTKRI